MWGLKSSLSKWQGTDNIENIFSNHNAIKLLIMKSINAINKSITK